MYECMNVISSKHFPAFISGRMGVRHTMKKNYMLYLDTELMREMEKRYPRAVSARFDEYMATELKRKAPENKEKAALDAKYDKAGQDYNFKSSAHALAAKELGLPENVNPRTLDPEKQKLYLGAFNKHLADLKKEGKK